MVANETRICPLDRDLSATHFMFVSIPNKKILLINARDNRVIETKAFVGMVAELVESIRGRVDEEGSFIRLNRER